MTSSGKPLCINCISGEKLPGTPRGTIRTVGPYQTYVTTPLLAEQTVKGKVIASFSDVFGLDLVNNKLVADILADRAGFTVFVPDLFNGAPLPSTAMGMSISADELRSQSFFSKIRQMAKMATIMPWMIRHWPTGKYKDAEAFLEALRARENAEKLGVVGYCYGGKFAVDFNTKGLTDASVGCHPSFVKPDSFVGLKAPLMLNCSEEDELFPVKLLEEARIKVAADGNASEHDFKVFPGTTHGFCARPNLADEAVKKGFEEATARTADWFRSHL